MFIVIHLTSVSTISYAESNGGIFILIAPLGNTNTGANIRTASYLSTITNCERLILGLRAIPFNIHTPLLTRLLILDPFGNGFWEDPLGNLLFFAEPPRKFSIFLKPFGNTCWQGSIAEDPFGNFEIFLFPSEILYNFLTPQKQTLLTRLLIFYPFGNFQIFITPSEILYNFLTPQKKTLLTRLLIFYPFGNFQIFITLRNRPC